MQPTQSEIFERVVHIIEDELCPGTSIHADALRYETRLSDIHVDEFDRVAIAVDAEDEFGIHIDSDEMRGWQTIGDICQSVENRMGV